MSRSDSIQSFASAGVWGALSLPVRANASQRSSDGPSRSGFGAIPSATCSAGKFSTANGGSGALPPPPPPAPPPPLWICGGTSPTRRASSSPAWSSMSVGSSEEMRHQSPGSRESAAVSEVAWTSIFVWSSRFSESNHSSSDHRDGSGARSGSFQAKWTSRNDAIHSLASAPLPLPARVTASEQSSNEPSHPMCPSSASCSESDSLAIRRKSLFAGSKARSARVEASKHVMSTSSPSIAAGDASGKPRE